MKKQICLRFYLDIKVKFLIEDIIKKIRIYKYYFIICENL